MKVELEEDEEEDLKDGTDIDNLGDPFNDGAI